MLSDTGYVSLVDKLRTSFVDLRSPQTITGPKFFAADETEFVSVITNAVTAYGSISTDGDLAAANIITQGLVDGVDISVLQQSAFATFADEAGLIASVDAMALTSSLHGKFPTAYFIFLRT